MSALRTAVACERPAAAPHLHVDLAAVAANTRVLAAAGARLGAGRVQVMAVVKADGFGHGAVDVARTALAHGATWLGVTSLAEAVPLREAGLEARILSWLNPVDLDAGLVRALDLDLAVPSLAHLQRLTRDSRPGRVRVHLHLDTGLARDGAASEEWGALCVAARRAERQGAVQVVGIMSHLACADTPDDPANAAARRRFAHGLRVARAAGLRPQHLHLAATAATLTEPRSHHTMVRVGAGLVGIDPSGTTRLTPALTLTAPLVSTRRVRAGTPVGYGGTWTAPEATTLGLLPLGYGDGLPRHARAQVLVGGRRRPLVGRMSMDQAVVDLGDLPVGSGTTVTVLGPGTLGEPTAAQWALWSGALVHEIVTGLRVRGTRSIGPATSRAPAPPVTPLRSVA